MSRKYVDIHCHPSTKPFLKLASGLVQKEKPSLWSVIKYHLFPPIDEWFAKDALDSQSSLSQLTTKESCYELIINPVTPMERELAKYTLFPIAVLLAFIPPRQISRTYFKSMQSEDFPYAERLEQELSFVASTKNIHLLTHKESTFSSSLINIGLAIEGGHCLYSTPKFQDSTEQVIERLQRILSTYRILYLTLTHLAPSPLANHCFSMKNVSRKKVHHFYPANISGISEVGLRVIDQCLQQPKHTLIDIKHMSLRSRLQFYAYRKEKNYNTPILATHNGCTGMNINTWKKQLLANANKWLRTQVNDKHVVSIPIERPNGIKLRNIQTKFNPASINIFDDDIEEIIRSGGLIGISFDERILGRGTKKHYLEVLAEKELNELLQLTHIQAEDTTVHAFNKKVNYYDIKMKKPTINPRELSTDKLNIRNTFKSRTADALYFLNNLLHMVKIAKQTIDQQHLNTDPWSYFALGSDFDGVIDAIDCCKTSKKMNQFEELLLQLLAEYFTFTQTAKEYGVDEKNLYASLVSKFTMLSSKNAKTFFQKHL